MGSFLRCSSMHSSITDPLSQQAPRLNLAFYPFFLVESTFDIGVHELVNKVPEKVILRGDIACFLQLNYGSNRFFEFRIAAIASVRCLRYLTR
ncbi:hypothetical protein CULT_170040 [[Clostridium] ultunense Esp]|nr:hypothetical protein CULT_170040 [[Clostridium] ultunense Esp]